MSGYKQGLFTGKHQTSAQEPMHLW